MLEEDRKEILFSFSISISYTNFHQDDEKQIIYSFGYRELSFI